MERQTLSDFVRRVMLEKNLSSYDVARRSAGAVSQSTVTKLLNGDVKSHNIETLDGIAKGINEPVEKLILLARGLPTPSTYELYAERFDAHDLNESEWNFLEYYFKQYVESFRAGKAEREAHIQRMVNELNATEKALEVERERFKSNVVATIGSPKADKKKAA